MHILVTGAQGMLGRDLVPYLESRGHRVTGIDMEVDITDPSAIAHAVRAHAPDAVINGAAYTNVDAAEEDEATATRVNGDGAGNVAAACAALGIPMVQVSTDYVFDGTAGRDYAEDDPVAPMGAYGRSKLAGERAAVAAHPGGVRIARTAWLYGAHGRNFIDTMRGLGCERDEVTVVADQVGCPTWTRDLAPALEALISAPPGGANSASLPWIQNRDGPPSHRSLAYFAPDPEGTPGSAICRSSQRSETIGCDPFTNTALTRASSPSQAQATGPVLIPAASSLRAPA